MTLRRKLTGLAVLVGMIAALLVGTNAAFGVHSSADDVLALDLTGNPGSFEHDGVSQSLPTNKCEVQPDPADTGTPAPDLVALDADGKGPGISKNSLGQKSGGSQGVACGRVSGSERLELSLVDTDVLDGLEIFQAELDIEVKKDGWVQATVTILDSSGTPQELAGPYELRTGSSIDPTQGAPPTANSVVISADDPLDPYSHIANCGALSDSGPDAGNLDNCRWVIIPGVPFDTIEFTILEGEFGLEGGKDSAALGPLATTRGLGPESLFFLTDIDGVLACGDQIDTPELGDVAGSIIRVGDPGTEPFNCDEIKPFTFSADDSEDQISFIPEGGEGAAYVAKLEFGIAHASSNPLDVTYDPDGPDDTLGFRALPLCDIITPGALPTDVSDALDSFGFDTSLLDGSDIAVPTGAGDTWCEVGRTTYSVGGGDVKDVVFPFGMDDPFWRGN